MNDRHEQSFGIVPLQQDRGHLRVLLIQHQAGHWSFPKGHPELHERERDAAERELREETHLFVAQYYPCEPVQESYRFQRKGITIHKCVTYFLAEVSGEVSIQPAELKAFAWVALERAEEQMTFPEAKALVRQVIERLQG